MIPDLQIDWGMFWFVLIVGVAFSISLQWYLYERRRYLRSIDDLHEVTVELQEMNQQVAALRSMARSTAAAQAEQEGQA